MYLLPFHTQYSNHTTNNLNHFSVSEPAEDAQQLNLVTFDVTQFGQDHVIARARGIAEPDIFQALADAEDRAVSYFGIIASAVQNIYPGIAAGSLRYEQVDSSPLTSDEYWELNAPPPIFADYQPKPSDVPVRMSQAEIDGYNDHSEDDQEDAQDYSEPEALTLEQITDQQEEADLSLGGTAVEVSNTAKSNLIDRVKQNIENQTHPNMAQAQVLQKNRTGNTPAKETPLPTLQPAAPQPGKQSTKKWTPSVPGVTKMAKTKQPKPSKTPGKSKKQTTAGSSSQPPDQPTITKASTAVSTSRASKTLPPPSTEDDDPEILRLQHKIHKRRMAASAARQAKIQQAQEQLRRQQQQREKAKHTQPTQPTQHARLSLPLANSPVRKKRKVGPPGGAATSQNDQDSDEDCYPEFPQDDDASIADTEDYQHQFATPDHPRQQQSFKIPRYQRPHLNDSSADEDEGHGSMSSQQSGPPWKCTGSACNRAFYDMGQWIIHRNTCDFNYATPGDRNWGSVPPDMSEYRITDYNRTLKPDRNGEIGQDNNMDILNKARFYPISADWNIAHSLMPYKAKPVRINYPLQHLGITVSNKKLLANMHDLTFTNLSLLHFTDENLARSNVKFSSKKPGADDEEVAKKESRMPVLLKALNNYRIISRMIFPGRYEADIFYTAMITKYLDPANTTRFTGEVLIRNFKEHLETTAMNAQGGKPPHSIKDIGAEVQEAVIQSIQSKLDQVLQNQGAKQNRTPQPRNKFQSKYKTTFRGYRTVPYNTNNRSQAPRPTRPPPANMSGAPMHCFKFNSSSGCKAAAVGKT